MDPAATLRIADQAISDLDALTARLHLASYREWRARGGFQPSDVAGSDMIGDKFAAYCERRLRDMVRQ